jgi:hypothetical protein
MAVLQNGDLSLEIGYCSFEFGCVIYGISLRWRGEPVLNDAILKRGSKYWANRCVGAIRAESESECGILQLIRRVLETNKADFWESTDPDILLAVYPGSGFPLLPVTRGDSPEKQAHVEVFERERREREPMPSDCWEMILFVDAYNFEGAKGYYGTGLCFSIASTREELQRFYMGLKREYELFRVHWRVQEENEAIWGAEYRPPEF